jgi:hypothetical protein
METKNELELSDGTTSHMLSDGDITHRDLLLYQLLTQGTLSYVSSGRNELNQFTIVKRTYQPTAEDLVKISKIPLSVYLNIPNIIERLTRSNTPLAKLIKAEIVNQAKSAALPATEHKSITGPPPPSSSSSSSPMSIEEAPRTINTIMPELLYHHLKEGNDEHGRFTIRCKRFKPGENLAVRVNGWKGSIAGQLALCTVHSSNKTEYGELITVFYHIPVAMEVKEDSKVEILLSQPDGVIFNIAVIGNYIKPGAKVPRHEELHVESGTMLQPVKCPITRIELGPEYANVPHEAVHSAMEEAIVRVQSYSWFMSK